MTNPNYRHYVLIVDRSKSMCTIREEAENGINHFIREQAALPGKATLSLYQFDSVHDTVHDFAPLNSNLAYQLVPRGMTALFDASGFAITDVGKKLSAMPEDQRPGQVYVLIATDGLNNDSHEWTGTQVGDLIYQQQNTYGWNFTYLGANQDVFAVAGSIAVAVASSLDYDATREGTQSAYASASAAVGRSVKSGGQPVSYTSGERKAAKGQPDDH